MDQYITKFQKLSMLVMDILERRQIVLFMDGLTEPVRGWVKGFNPATLLEAIKKARSITSLLTSSSRVYSHSKPPVFPRDKDDKPLLKKPLFDEATREEL